MKFYAEPNHLIIDRNTYKPLFRFNEQGEYETNDERLIERLKPYFRYENNEIKIERVNKNVKPKNRRKN